MNVGRPGLMEAPRWFLSGVVALAAHVGFAWGFFDTSGADDAGGTSGAFVIELAAVPVARADVPGNIAPGPDQVEAAAAAAAKATDDAAKETKAEQEPQPDLLPKVKPSISEPEVPLPPPVEAKVPEQRVEQVAQAPAPMTTAMQAVAERVAEVPAAPVRGAPSKTHSDTLPTWKAKLETLLERSKRYPAHAQSRHQEGVVHVSFVIDRVGKLVSREIRRGSGHSALDEEALALLERAQPFPELPHELKAEQVRLAVPIRFNLR